MFSLIIDVLNVNQLVGHASPQNQVTVKHVQVKGNILIRIMVDVYTVQVDVHNVYPIVSVLATKLEL